MLLNILLIVGPFGHEEFQKGTFLARSSGLPIAHKTFRNGRYFLQVVGNPGNPFRPKKK